MGYPPCVHCGGFHWYQRFELRSYPKLRRWIRILVTLAGLVMIIVGAVGYYASGENDPNTYATTYVMWAAYGGILILAFWTCALAAFFGRTAGREVLGALQPIPSPVEIELQLRREGHDPTIQDVAAIHQMLVSRRNEHAAVAAIMVGGLYVASRGLPGQGGGR